MGTGWRLLLIESGGDPPLARKVGQNDKFAS
jgi:hypothetical protein